MPHSEPLVLELSTEFAIEVAVMGNARHASKVAAALADLHPKMLRVEGENDPQESAEVAKRAIGRLVERSLALCGLTKQDAAFRMGYSDSGVISRWCSGTERPLFDKLHHLSGFRAAWTVAQAESDPEMEVETIVTIRRRVG